MFQESRDKVVQVCRSQAELNGLLCSKHRLLAHAHPAPESGIVEHSATTGKAGSALVSMPRPCRTPPNAGPGWMLSITIVSRACPGT